jgi:hypothetical protein
MILDASAKNVVSSLPPDSNMACGKEVGRRARFAAVSFNIVVVADVAALLGALLEGNAFLFALIIRVGTVIADLVLYRVVGGSW